MVINHPWILNYSIKLLNLVSGKVLAHQNRDVESQGRHENAPAFPDMPAFQKDDVINSPPFGYTGSCGWE
jgi:hypothetical protein